MNDNALAVTALNPKRHLYNLIGNIANNPSFLKENDVEISKNDAVDRLQAVMLGAVLNVAYNSHYAKKINPYDMDTFVSQYPNIYKLWKKHDGNMIFASVADMTDISQIRHEYDTVKKYTYLRKFKANGIDIKDIFDYTDRNMIDDSVARLDKMSVADLIDHYADKTNRIKKHHQKINNDVQSFEIGDGIREHIKNLTKSSMFGYPFQNGYYNQLFGGMRRQKMLIRSTVTGGGKTRQALKDFCNVAFSEYYDLNSGKWVSTGKSVPALFISTELNKAELQNIILAYLTGLNSKTIAFGQFNASDKGLIDHALKVIDDANFYFEYLENFSCDDIEAIVEDYARRKHVSYVDFDYIQESPRLMSEMQKSYGKGLRSDQALVYLSKQLKKIAEKYHVFMMTATQVNGSFADDDKERSRTEYVLRGGKSIADKCDFGVITSRFTKADRNAFEKLSALSKYHPNFAHHVYKNRAGTKDIIIWTKFNFGNLREKPLLVTDYEYNILPNIKPLRIKYV